MLLIAESASSPCLELATPCEQGGLGESWGLGSPAGCFGPGSEDQKERGLGDECLCCLPPQEPLALPSIATSSASGSLPSLSLSSHQLWGPAACSFPGENARSWGALGEARPGQSSLSAGALRLSDFTFTFHFHALEKEMATHSSVLA